MSWLHGGHTLDTARGPEDLIPGDLDALDATIAGLTKLGVSAQDAGAGMARLCTGQGWTGPAAEAFRAAWQLEPDRWSSLGDALANAAQVLEPYRDAVRHGQGEALVALEQWRQAQQLSAVAAAEYRRLQDAYQAARLVGRPVSALPAFQDPGSALRAAAIARLSAACTRVADARLPALRILAASRDALPPEPGAWQRFADGFVDTFSTVGTQAQDFAGGAVDATINSIGTIQRLNPASPYNVTHPADYRRRLDEAGHAVTNLVEHPGATLRSMAQNAVQVWTHNPGRALGSLLPGVLLGAATGGVGGAATAGSDLVEGATEEATTVAGSAGEDMAQAVGPVGSPPAGFPSPDGGLASADHAAATQISNAGLGLDTVEADLAKIHVHVPDGTGPSTAAPTDAAAPVHPTPEPGSAGQPSSAGGHYPGNALPPTREPTLPGALADNPQVQADLARTVMQQPDLAMLDEQSGPVRWRQDNNILYRAGNRGPEVFESGFTPRDMTNLDLPDYVANNTESGFISTTTDPRFWELVARGSDYFYEIDAPGGIDVNASIPDNQWDTEYEVSMPGGIRPERVKGLWPIVHDGRGGASLGQYVPNPNYRPLK
jgi:hypothetical protein